MITVARSKYCICTYNTKLRVIGNCVNLSQQPNDNNISGHLKQLHLFFTCEDSSILQWKLLNMTRVNVFSHLMWADFRYKNIKVDNYVTIVDNTIKKCCFQNKENIPLNVVWTITDLKRVLTARRWKPKTASKVLAQS